jgi:hypothetical protein
LPECIEGINATHVGIRLRVQVSIGNVQDAEDGRVWIHEVILVCFAIRRLYRNGMARSGTGSQVK